MGSKNEFVPEKTTEKLIILISQLFGKSSSSGFSARTENHQENCLPVSGIKNAPKSQENIFTVEIWGQSI